MSVSVRSDQFGLVPNQALVCLHSFYIRLKKSPSTYLKLFPCILQIGVVVKAVRVRVS